MAYMIKHKDGTQAVYASDSGRMYIRDIGGDNGDCKIFLTEDKELAHEIWRAVGADYGEFEIVKAEDETCS